VLGSEGTDRPAEPLHQDLAGPLEHLVGDREEELGERQGLDPEVGEAGEVLRERLSLPAGGGDGVAVVQEVEAAVSVPVPPEPVGPVGDVEGGGGEVGEVGGLEGHPGCPLAEGVAGVEGWAVAVELDHAPGPGVVGLGGGGVDVALREVLEEVRRESVARLIGTFVHGVAAPCAFEGAAAVPPAVVPASVSAGWLTAARTAHAASGLGAFWV